MKQPNDTGLDAAIDKYKQAVELDPAMRLLMPSWPRPMSGSMQFGETPPLSTSLEETVRLRWRSIRASWTDISRWPAIFEQTGNEQGALDEIAKALSLDPSNPNTGVAGADLHPSQSVGRRREDFSPSLEGAPQLLVSLQRAWLWLTRAGQVSGGDPGFRAASLAAPRNSMALSNLGAEYLQIGEFAEATEILKTEPGLGS
jgi:tetratricopeptide (TPR) repeat protein